MSLSIRSARIGWLVLSVSLVFVCISVTGDQPMAGTPPDDPDALSAKPYPLESSPEPGRFRRLLRRVTTRDDSAHSRTWRRDVWIQRVKWAQASPEGRDRDTQEPAGDQVSTSAPEHAEAPSTAVDLTVPRPARVGGAQPTLKEEAKQQVEPGGPPEAPTPLYLNHLLGLDDAPVRTYGWIENSFTGNANGIPRQWQQLRRLSQPPGQPVDGQPVLPRHREPARADDTVNFGFRFDMLFGNDWQFTKYYGLFDRAFPNNHFAGLDLPQIYGEVHLPILTPGGLDIKGGPILLAGRLLEQSRPSPARFGPVLTLWTSRRSRFFGAYDHLHLHRRLNVFNGTINGFDRWINEPYKWGYIGGFAWTSRDAEDQRRSSASAAPRPVTPFPSGQPAVLPDRRRSPPAQPLAGRPIPFYNKSYAELLRRWS